MEQVQDSPVLIPVEGLQIEGNLAIPRGAQGVVLFAHGSGSSRHSPRNQYVAQELCQGGLATLLIDLLTREEERLDEQTGEFRFDIPMLSRRLIGATDWLTDDVCTRTLKIGYFGASTGAAAALIAAAYRPKSIHAIVSRGGRPDLAEAVLAKVRAPTLLIVGGEDHLVIELNQQVLAHLSPNAQLAIVPGATHLFEEAGALEEVAHLARDWFTRYLRPLG